MSGLHSIPAVMQRLGDDTAQQLRACTQIPEFSAAICALVLNAVEADACHILVEVDASQYSATVTDNGHGICFDSMKLLGVRCCSSKLHAKGDALASLAQMSTLMVSSRAKGCFETYHKQITPSNSLQAAEPPHASARANGISIISLCAVPRSSQGTTIELSNFMFNQPVRRRRAASKGVDATLQEVKAALHALMLPFTGIELILRPVDSKASLLHVAKERTLPDACRQLFWQHLEHIYTFSTAADTLGWNISGAFAAPPATFDHCEMQLLYVNSRAAACSVLQILLKDWFAQSLRLFQASERNSTGNRMNMRTPEPGYVLCISCPASAVQLSRNLQHQIEVSFSKSDLSHLSELLQQACSSAWGPMPSSWKQAAAGKTKDVCHPGEMAAAQRHNKATCSKLPGLTQLTQKQKSAHPLLPVHGLQLSSVSRSLACGRLKPQSGDQHGSFIHSKSAMPHPLQLPTEQLQPGGMQQAAAAYQDSRPQQQEHLQDIELLQHATQDMKHACRRLDTNQHTQACSVLVQQHAPGKCSITDRGEAPAAAAQCEKQILKQHLLDEAAHLQSANDLAVEAGMFMQHQGRRVMQPRATRVVPDDFKEGDWFQAGATAEELATPDNLQPNNIRAAGSMQHNLPTAEHYGEAHATDWMANGCPTTPAWSPGQTTSVSPALLHLAGHSPKFQRKQQQDQDDSLFLELYEPEQLQHSKRQGWLQEDWAQPCQEHCAVPLLPFCCDGDRRNPEQQAGQHPFSEWAEPGMAWSFKDDVTGADGCIAAGWQVGMVSTAAAAAGTAAVADCAREAPAHPLHQADWQQQWSSIGSEGQLPRKVEDEMHLAPGDHAANVLPEVQWTREDLYDFQPSRGCNKNQEHHLVPLLFQEQVQHHPHRWLHHGHEDECQCWPGQDGPTAGSCWRSQQHPDALHPQPSTNDDGHQSHKYQWSQYAGTWSEMSECNQAADLQSEVPVFHVKALKHQEPLHQEQLQQQQGVSIGQAFARDGDPWLNVLTSRQQHDEMQMHVEHTGTQAQLLLVPSSAMQQMGGCSAAGLSKQDVAQPHSSHSGSIFLHQLTQPKHNSVIEPDAHATNAAHLKAMQTAQPHASINTLDNDLFFLAEYDTGMARPPEHAKMTVDIMQQMPTCSEETVQQLNTYPDQQADSRCHAHHGEDEQKGMAGVLEAEAPEAAIAAGTADNGAELHDSSPVRPLPAIFLAPFKQRLCHSAPPAAKPACRFASSSSGLTAEVHSNRAFPNRSSINRCLVYKGADAPGPSAADMNTVCGSTNNSSFRIGRVSAKVRDSCSLNVSGNGDSGATNGTNVGRSSCKIIGTGSGGGRDRGAGDGPRGAGSGVCRKHNISSGDVSSSLTHDMGSSQLKVRQIETTSAMQTVVATAAGMVPKAAAGAAVPAVDERKPGQMCSSVVGGKMPKRRKSSPGALFSSSSLQQVEQHPDPNQNSETEQLKGGTLDFNSKPADSLAASRAGSSPQQQHEVGAVVSLPEGSMSNACRGKQRQGSNLAAAGAMTSSRLQPAWLQAQMQSQGQGSRQKQLQQTKLAFKPVQKSAGATEKDTPAYPKGSGLQASAGQCRASANTASEAAGVGSGTAAAAAAVVAAANTTDLGAGLRNMLAADEKQKPLKPALKRERVTKLHSSAAPAVPSHVVNDITAVSCGAAGMLASYSAISSKQHPQQDLLLVNGAVRLCKRVRFSVGTDKAVQQPGIDTAVASCQLPQLQSEVHAGIPLGGQQPDRALHSSELQQPVDTQCTDMPIIAATSSKVPAAPAAAATAGAETTTAGVKASCSSAARCSSRFWSSENTKLGSHVGGLAVSTSSGNSWTAAINSSGSPAPAILSVEELQSQQLKGSVPLVPASITRQQLVTAGVIDQVDRKMVVAACGNILLAVDQHAADERVQLEALQQQLAAELLQQQQQVASASATASFNHTSHCCARQLPQQQQQQQQKLLLQHRRLFPPQQLHLTMAEAKAWLMHGQQIQSWGWILKAADNSSATATSVAGSRCDAGSAADADSIAAEGSVPRTECDKIEAAVLARASAAGVTSQMMLHQIPVLAGVQLGFLDLQLYLHQLLDAGSGGGCSNSSSSSHGPLPPGVLRVLRSKACRTALMFNTQLSWSHCNKLLRQLAETQLCFCCAHGRPTTVPLVDLFALHQMMSQKQQTGVLAGLLSTAEAVASGEDNCQAREISHFQYVANRRSKQQLEKDFLHCSSSHSTAVTSRIRLMLGHNTTH